MLGSLIDVLEAKSYDFRAVANAEACREYALKSAGLATILRPQD